MRTDEQMATIVTRATKELHLGLAKKWGFPVTELRDQPLAKKAPTP